MRRWLEAKIVPVLFAALVLTAGLGVVLLFWPGVGIDLLGSSGDARPALTRLLGLFLVLFGLIYVPVLWNRERHRNLLVFATLEKTAAAALLFVDVTALGEGSVLLLGPATFDLIVALFLGAYLIFGGPPVQAAPAADGPAPAARPGLADPLDAVPDASPDADPDGAGTG